MIVDAREKSPLNSVWIQTTLTSTIAIYTTIPCHQNNLDLVWHPFILRYKLNCQCLAVSFGSFALCAVKWALRKSRIQSSYTLYQYLPVISITHGSLEPGPKNIKNCTNSTNISAFLRNSARYGSPSGLGSTFGIETNICHDVGTASAGRTFRTHGWVPLHQPWRCRKSTKDACGILYHDNFTKRKQGCWGSFILLTIISNHIQSYPSLCSFCREVVPTKPFTNTALCYKMKLESEPTPLATKWFGCFYDGSKANVGHYKMTLRKHFVVKTGCNEK